MVTYIDSNKSREQETNKQTNKKEKKQQLITNTFHFNSFNNMNFNLNYNGNCGTSLTQNSNWYYNQKCVRRIAESLSEWHWPCCHLVGT